VDHLHTALDEGLSMLGPYRAIGFLERMQDAYAAADFALSRAGGSTLAELTALGLPSILVPYPYAAHGHQGVNAGLLAQAGAAIAIDQQDLTAERLAESIRALATDDGLRGRMAECARQQGRPDAALRVAQELAVLAGFGSQLKHTFLLADDIPSQPSRAA
jgi:UDP-N-acetylglucosamine--N-acetylmuramyl-(pentapeptide) pyrophosphoryl-undecaprenol N-acetylglucosamine transferase